MKVSVLTRTVWIVSFVSLFNDVSTEMLYPVMPIYLSTIGFSALWIGLLEGIAEAIAGLSKGYFGMWSDRIGKRLPFVVTGYFLSAVSRPLLAFFAAPGLIFTARTLDRFGKGVRTAARDSILSSEASIENKGKIFGFHRGMDTLGAAIGPVLALVYLHFYPKEYTTLFLIAFLPAVVSVLLSTLIREKRIEKNEVIKQGKNPFQYFSYWGKSSKEYKKIVLGFLAFALVNSSDMFLLLMAKSRGMDDTEVIGLYIFYNLVYALFAYPIGMLADKLGMRIMYVMGLLFFAITYAGFAFTSDPKMYLILFFVYGLYAASSESITKAWITNIVPRSESGTAIGMFASASSLSLMFASFITGILWVSFSPELALVLPAMVAFLSAMYFLAQKNLAQKI